MQDHLSGFCARILFQTILLCDTDVAGAATVLGIYFYVNFVPGEYFNGLLDFREPAVKMSPARLNAQHVGFEREGQQFGHKGAMG
ncbi:hypothetical protein EYF80_022896 [Liparis tanakae]|uniref:Uncharacterized protein n=1 Tax=Liparis tanakae TaxID=230148 RepID=A0A4Z2HM45_9TELE|nr:hypothetical protein EYF80_022896 [Liparis tanakae]